MGFSAMADWTTWPPSLSRDRKYTSSRVFCLRDGSLVLSLNAAGRECYRAVRGGLLPMPVQLSMHTGSTALWRRHTVQRQLRRTALPYVCTAWWFFVNKTVMTIMIEPRRRPVEMYASAVIHTVYMTSRPLTFNLDNLFSNVHSQKSQGEYLGKFHWNPTLNKEIK